MGPAGQDVVVVECKAGNDVREASQNGLQTARGHFEYLDSEIIPHSNSWKVVIWQANWKGCVFKDYGRIW